MNAALVTVICGASLCSTLADGTVAFCSVHGSGDPIIIGVPFLETGLSSGKAQLWFGNSAANLTPLVYSPLDGSGLSPEEIQGRGSFNGRVVVLPGVQDGAAVKLQLRAWSSDETYSQAVNSATTWVFESNIFDYTTGSNNNLPSAAKIPPPIMTNLASFAARPHVSWNPPTQLNAGDTAAVVMTATATFPSGSVQGRFDYRAFPGGVLLSAQSLIPEGVQQITAAFVPDPGIPILSVTNTNSIVVVQKIDPVITWADPAPITYPTRLSAIQLNAIANVSGMFVYAPDFGALLNAGMAQVLNATFTPSDTSHYNSLARTVTIDVLKGKPAISWSKPPNIVYPNALSATQLNATSSVPGTFHYSPDFGQILQVGDNQILSATFTPADSSNYDVATPSVKVNVVLAPPPTFILKDVSLSPQRVLALPVSVLTGARVTLEWSEDLVSWQTLLEQTATTGRIDFSDVIGTHPRRYYRAHIP